MFCISFLVLTRHVAQKISPLLREGSIVETAAALFQHPVPPTPLLFYHLSVLLLQFSPPVTAIMLNTVYRVLMDYYMEIDFPDRALDYFSEMVACTTDYVRGRG